jgi:hypothetical protein
VVSGNVLVNLRGKCFVCPVVCAAVQMRFACYITTAAHDMLGRSAHIRWAFGRLGVWAHALAYVGKMDKLTSCTRVKFGAYAYLFS